MSLFGNKKQELPPLITDEELFPSVNFDTVLEWLVGLSAKDYAKVCEVARIHRVADQQSAAVLGRSAEPTTFIDDPKDKLQTMPTLVIDKEPDFLEEDEKPKTKTPKSKKVTVKKG